MAHYALLDGNNIVTQVIVGKDEGEEGVDWEAFYGEFHGQLCKRTSYNTAGGVHKEGGEPLRKNFAGIGYTYDPVLDAFIAPKPAGNYSLDEDSGLWVHDAELGIVGNGSRILQADGVDFVTVCLWGSAESIEEVLINDEPLEVVTDERGYGEFELATDTPGLMVVEWGGFSLEVAAL